MKTAIVFLTDGFEEFECLGSAIPFSLKLIEILIDMNFKLNGFNKIKPEGSRTRGKRTIAKEKLYKHIHGKICEIHPTFNIGVSTGSRGYENPHWNSPYEHWLFVPSE